MPNTGFRDRPIRQKLMVIIMVTTAAAMVLACIGILTFDGVSFRQRLESDLTALTRIIAANSAASLEFDDPQSGKETLQALQARKNLVGACLYLSNGTMLARYMRQNASQACPPPDLHDELRYGPNNVTVSYGVRWKGQRVGTLMLLYDLDEIIERRQLYGTTVVAVLLVSSVLAFLLSSRLRALIADPVSQLVKVTTAVAETNDYGIRAQKVSDDELGVLVDRFNEMLAGIQSRDTNLRNALLDRENALLDVERATERFRFLAESMPQKICTATPEGEITYFNRQWMEFTGLTYEQLRNSGWKDIIHPDDLKSTIRTWRGSLESGEAYQMQHRFRRADGAYRWHLTRAQPMRDALGGLSMWIGSNTDIHEQKEKEEELRHANEDLQQFAYSASHDLQEPVRNVTVYSELIARRYHEQLDDEGRRYLGFLAEGGRRLAMLINDLLAYTSVGATDADTTTHDVSVVLQHTLAGLAQAIRETNATITADPLPEVYMGEAHLQLLLQNLIGNALKYRAEEPPRVHISAVWMGASWRFAVQDNGIGIDPTYKEKIFGVFKRLHRDHNGTGIGLAICQRVVERYGGRIWVDSTPGNGATFYFTIPRQAGPGYRAAAERANG